MQSTCRTHADLEVLRAPSGAEVVDHTVVVFETGKLERICHQTPPQISKAPNTANMYPLLRLGKRAMDVRKEEGGV
jgi:hypothetical protein